jgi:hypothetical protein
VFCDLGKLSRHSEHARFYDQLMAETHEDLCRTLAVPQLHAALRGNITIEAYVGYLTELYHFVGHLVPLMHAAEHRLTHRPQLVEALRAYIQEETGHDQRILDDIEDMDGNLSAVIGSTPLPATQLLIDYGHEVVRDLNVMGIFGIIFMTEALSNAFERCAVSAVLEEGGYSAHIFSGLEEDYDVRGAGLAHWFDGIDDPAEQHEIIAVTRNMFRLFGDMFADLPGDDIDAKFCQQESLSW